MDTAKVTSFFGGFLYLIFFGFVLFFGQAFSKILSEGFGVENSSLIALILAGAFLVAVGNFCFSYFIQEKESFHENLENAFFFSLQLVIIPAILFVGFIVIFAGLGK